MPYWPRGSPYGTQIIVALPSGNPFLALDECQALKHLVENHLYFYLDLGTITFT